jgi:hypothetical protein
MTTPSVVPNIVVEPASLELGLGGNIKGVIFWEAGGVRFPEAGWTDYPLILFEWWLDAMQRIFRGESHNEHLEFMDGPFWIGLHVSGGAMTVKFVDGSGEEKVLAEFHARKDAIGRVILNAANSLVRSSHVLPKSAKELKHVRQLCDSFGECLSMYEAERHH